MQSKQVDQTDITETPKNFVIQDTGIDIQFPVLRETLRTQQISKRKKLTFNGPVSNNKIQQQQFEITTQPTFEVESGGVNTLQHREQKRQTSMNQDFPGYQRFAHPVTSFQTTVRFSHFSNNSLFSKPQEQNPKSQTLRTSAESQPAQAVQIDENLKNQCQSNYEKISQQQNQIALLKQVVKQMLAQNKGITWNQNDNLAPRRTSNIHQLYQDILLQDIEKKIECANTSVETQIQELQHKQAQIQQLRLDVAGQEKKIKMYDDILKQKKDNPKSILAQKVTGFAAFSKIFGKQTALLARQKEKKVNKEKVFDQVHDCIKDMLNAQTLVELMDLTKTTIRNVLQAEHVHFLIMDKDAVAQYKEEGGRLGFVHHASFGFQLILTDQEEAFKPKFITIRDVETLRCFNGSSCVWPVRAFQKNIPYDENQEGKLFMLIQLHNQISKYRFSPNSDADCLKVISKILYQIYKSISIQYKVKAAQKRASEILGTFKNLLDERRYLGLCHQVLDTFPKLFRFKSCAVLFVDPISKDLFKLPQIAQHSDITRRLDAQEKKKLDEQNYSQMIKYPINIGMTGQAIRENKIFYFNKQQRLPFYTPEIDNCLDLPDVQSLLIAPIYDNQGDFFGVIQLVNRVDDELIEQQDINELYCLIPCIGEVFKTVQSVKEVTFISDRIIYQMNKLKEDLECSVENLEGRNVQSIQQSIQLLQSEIYQLSQVQKLIK